MRLLNMLHSNKALLTLLALTICLSVLITTNIMTKRLESDEKQKVELWATATNMLADPMLVDSSAIDLSLRVISHNTTIPIVIVNHREEILSVRNLSYFDSLRLLENPKAFLEDFRLSGNAEIEIPIDNAESHHLYYKNSIILEWLPYAQGVSLALVLLFLLFAYVVFSKARKSEQDKVWIGLARETAHQLGTPTQALIGWTDLLESGDIDDATAAAEIRKDVERLKSIADRFSKIGSVPEMKKQSATDTIRKVVDYLSTRVSRNISIELQDLSDGEGTKPPHNAVLLGWTIENLCRNAIDAIDGKGAITISTFHDETDTYIDVKDTGKGMSASIARKIFKPGFTTKKRGWGIGLALAQRIVVEYHGGRIFVLSSEPDKGTTIRIILHND